MSDGHLETAATRLTSLVTRIKKTSAKTCRQGWATVFGLEETNTPRIIEKIVEVLLLCRDTTTLISTIKGIDHELYLKHVRHINDVFSENALSGSWSNVVNSFSQDTDYGLRVTHDILRTNSLVEHTVDVRNIEAIRKKITSVAGDVAGLADIPPKLGAFIYQSIQSILWALDNYEVFGSSELNKIVENKVGYMVVHPNEWVQYSDNPAVKGFVDVLTNVANTFTVLEGARQLGTGIFKLLSGNT
ncbi:MAG: hypothetical protein ACKVRP_02380 [Bacteroidota bacterium]